VRAFLRSGQAKAAMMMLASGSGQQAQHRLARGMVYRAAMA
jgi:hypothetical protein